MTLFTLYDKIYSGEIKLDLKSSLENYDVDKLWAETTRLETKNCNYLNLKKRNGYNKTATAYRKKAARVL